MGKALLFISDGTDEINLLDPKAITVNGWQPKLPELKQGGIYSDSALADGRDLVIEAYDNVVEEMPLHINGKDPDQIAAAQHVFFDLARKLRGFFTRSERETSPVYLGFRPKDQTNIQYALLKNYNLQQQTEAFGHSLKGSLFKPSSMAGTLLLEREPAWRGNPPGVIPSTPLSISHPDSPDGVSQNVQWVANHRSNYSLTHIYNYDDSAGTFSANLIGSSAFTYFPSPAGVNDIVYFGSTQGPFYNVIPYIGTPGSYTVTHIWEAWTGASWVNVTSSVETSQLGRDTNNGSIGEWPVLFEAPSGWSKTSINGVSAYWLRLRLSAFTAMATNPANSTHVVYTSRNEYVEVDSTAVSGDIDALLRIVLRAGGTNLTRNFANLIAIGAKSRGLSSFVSRLNCSGSQNPIDWNKQIGTDTLISSDSSTPSGDRAGVTFSTTITNIVRMKLQMTAWLTADRIYDWTGLYQVFLVCQQIGGSAGDVSVQLALDFGAGQIGAVFGDQKKLTRVGQGKEIVDMGRFRIPPQGIEDTISALAYPTFSILAQAVSSVPDLFLYELIILPIDEFAIFLKDPVFDRVPAFTVVSDPINSAFLSNRQLVVDSGIVREETLIFSDSRAFSNTDLWDAEDNVAGFEARALSWERRGSSPALAPERTTRLYFIFGSYPSGVISGALVKQSAPGAAIRIYDHERWIGLRGDE